MNRFRGDFSADGETIAIRRIMKNYPERNFVEIGANDGVRISATFGLVRDGWSGLSVEPNPKTFARLQRNLSSYPNVKTICCAAAPAAGRIKLFLGKNDEEGFLSTISTDDNDWYRQNRDDAFVEVDALPLTELLVRESTPHRFGLLLVDTEGMDLEVIQTLNFDQYRPRLLITEDYEPKNNQKFELLNAVGYRFLSRIGSNTLWLDTKA